MAGKSIKRGSNRVAYVIYHLSKNTLADIVINRIKAEVGEDSDEIILERLQQWLNPIAILRGDKPPNLVALAKRFDSASHYYQVRKALDGCWPNPEADGDDIPDEMRG